MGKCKDCKYWHDKSGERWIFAVGYGQCRRHAPKLILDENAVDRLYPGAKPKFVIDWALTYSEDWCGEWANKNKPISYPTWGDMCWPTQLQNIFDTAKISSVEQLTDFTPQRLCNLRHFGKVSLNIVRRKLAKYDLCLSGNESSKEAT